MKKCCIACLQRQAHNSKMYLEESCLLQILRIVLLIFFHFHFLDILNRRQVIFLRGHERGIESFELRSETHTVI